jgi:DNA-binding response OmpR family regulator
MTKVLVVDDDQLVLDSTQSFLEAQGYHVVCAQDGEEALTKFDEDPADIALIDIFMPKQGGFNAIMSMQNHIPIIAMSGVSAHQFEPLNFAESLGATASLSKPFQPSELLDTITAILKT